MGLGVASGCERMSRDQLGDGTGRAVSGVTEPHGGGATEWDGGLRMDGRVICEIVPPLSIVIGMEILWSGRSFYSFHGNMISIGYALLHELRICRRAPKISHLLLTDDNVIFKPSQQQAEVIKEILNSCA